MTGRLALMLALVLSTACASFPAAPTGPAPGDAPRQLDAAPAAQGMSIGDMAHWLKLNTKDFTEVKRGQWRVTVDGVIIVLLSGKEYIRMAAPIFPFSQLGDDQVVTSNLMRRLLQANFERSGPVRYSMYGNIAFANITFPRDALTADRLKELLHQLAILHYNTFRTGVNGYSARAPDDSPETDPRIDKTLTDPACFEDDGCANGAPPETSPREKTAPTKKNI